MKSRRWLVGCIGAAVVCILALFAVFFVTWQSIEEGSSASDWSYTELKLNVEQGRVVELDIKGNRGQAITRDRHRHGVQLPDNTIQLASELAANQPAVKVVFEPGGSGNSWVLVLIPNLILLAILVVVGWAVARQRRR